MIEQDTQSQEDPRLMSRENHGRRLPLFNRMGISRGWVVNGKFPDEAWENIEAHAIPIAPGGLNPVARIRAGRQLSEIRQKYGGDVTFLVLPDDECEYGWSARPVLPEDLTREPNEVLREGFEVMGSDLFLADMKRHAYMAITGHVDTK